MTTEWSLQEAELPALPPVTGRTAFEPTLEQDHDQPLAQPEVGEVPEASRDAVRIHLENVLPALRSLEGQSDQLAAWGVELAKRLIGGQRLLAAGNGGSAAEAQHLTAELVGRFDGERVPFSAIALHAESSAVTAIANDYGYDELFARQVRAHGRSGDILLLLSTSGKSPNLLRAAEAAARLNVTTWALTGPAPNPLAERCDEVVAIDALSANAQEGHLIALHALCRSFEAEIARKGRTAAGQEADRG